MQGREKGDVKQTACSLRTENKYYCDWLYLCSKTLFFCFLFNRAANGQYTAVALVANNILLALLVRKRHQTLILSILFLVFLPSRGRCFGLFMIGKVSSSRESIMRFEDGPINTFHEVWGCQSMQLEIVFICFHILRNVHYVWLCEVWASTCLKTSRDISNFNYKWFDVVISSKAIYVMSCLFHVEKILAQTCSIFLKKWLNICVSSF